MRRILAKRIANIMKTPITRIDFIRVLTYSQSKYQKNSSICGVIFVNFATTRSTAAEIYPRDQRFPLGEGVRTHNA